MSVSHPHPRAICKELMGRRNIITALMHVLHLTSSVLYSNFALKGQLIQLKLFFPVPCFEVQVA